MKRFRVNLARSFLCLFLVLLFIGVSDCWCQNSSFPKSSSSGARNCRIFRFSNDPPPLRLETTGKKWTPEEKRIVSIIFSDFESEFPQIIKKASCGLPIYIYRELGKNEEANSDGDSITITDSFFNHSNKLQQQICLHETLHLVDRAYIYSNSSEWKLICDANFANYIGDPLWISGNEVLADCIADRLLGRQSQIKMGKLKEFQMKILATASEEETRRALLYRKGIAMYEAKKFENAKALFTELRSFDEYWLQASVNLMRMYSFIHDEQSALLLCLDVLPKLDNQDDFSPNSLNFRKLACDYYIKSRSLEEAVDVCSKVIVKFPRSAEYYQRRAWLFQELGRNKESSADWKKYKTLKCIYEQLLERKSKSHRPIDEPVGQKGGQKADKL